MSSPVKKLGVTPGAHLDEEECLPFPIFMAELELLVGNSKSGKPDGVQLFELLQKLVATIPRTDKAVLKQHQRQCETMLYDVLVNGVASAVRRLIFSCFSSLYAYGDAISIYTRVNVLQTYLASKEGMSRSTPEGVRVGLLDFLAHLHLHYGRMLGNPAPESIGIALRTVSKSGNQDSVRCASLRLAAAVARSTSPHDRSAAAVQSDAWTIVQRYAKDRACGEVRAECLRVLGALCAAGGGALWREGAYGAEEALRLCLVSTEDSEKTVQDEAFTALGELAAASRLAAKSEAVTSEKRPAKKSAAERVILGCVRACLVAPLLDAVMHSKREACLGISKAWMAYIAAVKTQHHGSELTTELLEVAWLLINAVNEAARIVAEARMHPMVDSSGELGTGLAGSEMPPLQACALYVMRRGIMSALTEVAQRKLLERLANTLDKRLCTPAAVVALESLASLLEAVGEVTDETANTLEVLLQPYVSSNSAATRQQAAVAMAALAAAHPVAAARMLSGCLDTVANCALQLSAPLSVASAPPGSSSPSPFPKALAAAAAAIDGIAGDGRVMASSQPTRRTSASVGDGTGAGAVSTFVAPISVSPSRPMTPNGGVAGSGGPPGPAQRAVLDMCHGAALSASRLLLTTARAPLGCPARLQRRALALAEDLVTGPGPEHGFSRAICREVGFLLLGTLCALGVPQSARGPQEMAELWAAALGDTARRDLDERSHLQRQGVELDLAVQLWWRAVALQALSAYLAAAQSGLGPGAVPTSAFGRGRSTSMLPVIVGAASFCTRQTDSGLSRRRSGSVAGTTMAAAAALTGHSMCTDWQEVSRYLAPLVEPLLELLETQSYLQDPSKARGGPGGILAGAAAMFILSLLELHLRAPGGRISSSPSHTNLLTKACLRPFRQGLTPGAADALTLSGLRGLLSADDAPLGPWPPATDPLEDALRSFTGGRGAPHLPPWLSSEDYAALLSGTVGGPGATAFADGGGSGISTGLQPLGGADGNADADGGVGSIMGSAAPGGSLGGGNGGPGVETGGGVSSTTAGLAHATYPQSIGLEAALLTVQLVLLGRQMATSHLLQQLQVLEVILNTVQASKTFARQCRDVAACRRLPLGVAAAVVVLAGYGPAAMAARRTKAALDHTDKVPEKLLQLAQILMPDEDAATPAAAALSRATAETYAASAATGSDTWALRIVRALSTEVVASATEGRDSQLRAVLALALGAVHRARGGLEMQAAVAGSTEALVTAASRPGGAAAAAWVLHGLFLVACSAGGAFVPRVKTSLQLGQELLVSSFDSPALRAACARLANASVAVLGPEFSLGSLAYIRAKSLVAASGSGQAIAADGSDDGALPISGSGGADGGLGLVLFVQQIILFAPHAVPAAKHVPLLLSHLLSSRPDLRAASALTLRHLAERSAEALKPADAAPLLFAALDLENDARIAGHLWATITTILKGSAASGPSYWLELLSDVVFAAGLPTSPAASSGGGGDGPRGGDEDDDGKYTERTSSSVGPVTRPSRQSSVMKKHRSVREVLTAPHLRTRHFAAECLLRLIRVCVASDERHRDPSVLEWPAASRSASAQNAGGEDLLIAKLQVLVDMGFKLATCPLESLKPHGVQMLTLLVKLFGEVPDPLLPGARIMEQYQAQVVSALRSSLGARQAGGGGLPGFSNHSTGGASGTNTQGTPDTVQHPLLQIAGGALATCFLESGLAAGDALVMRRLMELLSAPLSEWHTLRFDAYAEWVGARARVELLRAHAQCSAIAASAATRGDALCSGIVTKAQEPHAVRLQALWAMLLQDHAVLCSQPEEVLEAYRSPLLEGRTPTVTLATEGGDVGSGSKGDAAEGTKDGKSEVGFDIEVDFGLTTAVAAVLRPVYAAAVPAALAAVAGQLPSPAELSVDPSACEQFRRLLEVGLMLLSDAAARLAHAVSEATRGAVALTAASVSSQDATAACLPSTPGLTVVAASDFPQLRDSAAQLAGILRALQRFVSAEYLTAMLRSVPVVDRQSASLDNGPATATTAAVPAAQDKAEPLVSPAVLRDLLLSLGSTAFHALIPLHWALLGGVVPASVGSLLAGLALLCSSLVRELCTSTPVQVLATVSVAPEDSNSRLGTEEADNDGHVDTTAPLQSRGNSAIGDRPVEGGVGRTSRATSLVLVNNPVGPSSIASDGAETLTTSAIETMLLLASVCAPYSYGTQHLTSLARSGSTTRATSSSSGGGAADALSGLSCFRPLFIRHPNMRGEASSGGSSSSGGSGGGGGGAGATAFSLDSLPGCVPLPALAAEAAAGLTQSIVQLLAAAQQLIRRAPWSSLGSHVGSLLELPLRLILTSVPGAPIVAAAQRYLDTTIAALLTRSESRPPTGASQSIPLASAGIAGADGGDGSTPATVTAAAIVAMTDVVDLHHKALKTLRRPDGNSSIAAASLVGNDEDIDAAMSRLQGRQAVIISTLLTCTAVFEAAEPFGPPQPTTNTAPVPSPSKGRTSIASSGSGSGSTTLHQHQPRPARNSLSAGSGPTSRLASFSKATAAAAATNQATSATPPAGLRRLDASTVRDGVLAVLAGAFQAAMPLAAVLVVLEAVRIAVQDLAAEDSGSPRGRWARTLVTSLVPPAVGRAGALLNRGKPLTGAEQSLVAECLKLLVLAATLAGLNGTGALDGVMQVLVPLLVDVAAPPAGPAAVTPALRDMAVKLISSLPTSASGTAFKTHLAAQPAQAKLRLQTALREAATAANATTAAVTNAAAAAPNSSTAAGSTSASVAATGGTSGGSAQSQGGISGPGSTAGRISRPPTIQLKTTFALPSPGK